MIKRNKIIKDIKDVLTNNFGENIKNVILFGSQAKGLAKKYSDYDILIVLKNDYNYDYKKQIIDRCLDIDLKYNVFTDIKLISLNEIENSDKGKYPLYEDALKEGIYA
jgi:uncharacterized protein